MILVSDKQRIFGDLFHQRRIGHQLAVAIAVEDRRQVEAKSVDVVVQHPVPQAKEDQLADDRVVAVHRVAATRVVAIRAAAVFEHVIDAVLQALEAERRAVLVAFGRVVEHDVENHLDAGLVQCADHLLELDDLRARLCAGGVTAVRREKSQRIVAPVVGPLVGAAKASCWSGTREPASARRPSRPSDFRYGIRSITPRYVPG